MIKERKVENVFEASSNVSSSPTKKTATSDQAPAWPKSEGKPISNTSGLKIEAFDFFHEMLNQCCGPHKLNVLEAASILKQFTPDVIKTVIYVIAENARKAAQSQDVEGNADDFQDLEISRITSGATGKQQKSKWQQMPELVQPRLTSPASNSCSPVSAAVQALMSFARPDAEEEDKKASETIESQEVRDTVEQAAERATTEKEDLSDFDADSMNPGSSSPFLQPMSSMIMLHSEPDKLQNTSDMLSSESDHDRPSFISSIRDSLTASSSCMSPHFPWIQSPQSKLPAEKDKEKLPRSSEKYLPSISSILGPINTSFSELPFQLHTSMPSFIASKAASKISATQTHFPQSPLNLDTSATGIAIQSISESLPSPGNLLLSSTNLGTKQQKTVFRTILPKPAEKTADLKQGYVPEQAIKVDNQTRKNDEKVNLLDSKSEQTKRQISRQNLSTDEPLIAILHPNPNDPLVSLLPKPLFISPLNKPDSIEKEQAILPKPLFNVISNVGERGLINRSGTSNRSLSATTTKGKKSNTPGNNSGNLEVASALLSMGSAESKGKKSAKVVSSFNREKATFDIEESSKAQRGNILFTATGTFQIEDIEIDPKKNKIGKGNHSSFLYFFRIFNLSLWFNVKPNSEFLKALGVFFGAFLVLCPCTRF